MQKTVVSIIPDKDASKEHAEEVEAWKQTESQELDRERFTRIMIEVSSTINTYCGAPTISVFNSETRGKTDSILGS